MYVPRYNTEREEKVERRTKHLYLTHFITNSTSDWKEENVIQLKLTVGCLESELKYSILPFSYGKG
jgi:hypothetical protein